MHTTDTAPAVPAWIDIDRLCPPETRRAFQEIQEGAESLISRIAALSRLAARIDAEPAGCEGDETLAMWMEHSGRNRAQEAVTLLQDLLADAFDGCGFGAGNFRDEVRARYAHLIDGPTEPGEDVSTS